MGAEGAVIGAADDGARGAAGCKMQQAGAEWVQIWVHAEQVMGANWCTGWCTLLGAPGAV